MVLDKKLFKTQMHLTNTSRIDYMGNQVKAKRIIIDFVKDNIMTVLTPLKTAKESFDTLINLYENKAPNQKGF